MTKNPVAYLQPATKNIFTLTHKKTPNILVLGNNNPGPMEHQRTEGHVVLLEVEQR